MQTYAIAYKRLLKLSTLEGRFISDEIEIPNPKGDMR